MYVGDLGYHWEPPTKFVDGIHPLMAIVGSRKPADEEISPGYIAECKLCGDVTQRESDGIVSSATMQQAELYVRRHLARHLAALSNEIAKFSR